MRPNILLITADDMNYDSPGFTGCGVPDITPNLDMLAEEGIRFVHSHVNIAVCQPSRQGLMTGRYPHRNGGLGFDPINANIPTLQERLHAAGFLNGIIGKVKHLAPRNKFCWDLNYDMMDLGYGRDSKLYYKYTSEFLKKADNEDKPFFLMVNSHDPHRPFAGSDDEKDKDYIWEKGWENNSFEIYGPPPTANRYYKPEEINVPGFLSDIPDVRKEVAQYFTSVHRCDETIGEVLRALSESGFKENTLVMFLSDNGMAFPFAKANCYLTSTRTPWIIRWPEKIKAGQIDSEHFISGIDFMPTILEASGLEPEKDLDGNSFLDILYGAKAPVRDKVFTFFHRTAMKNTYSMRCTQTEQFGYIWNGWSDGQKIYKNESQNGLTFKAMKAAAENNENIKDRVKLFEYRVVEEFYDFKNDPCALNNLIEDDKYKKKIQKMREDILSMMVETGDPDLEKFKSHIKESR